MNTEKKPTSKEKPTPTTTIRFDDTLKWQLQNEAQDLDRSLNSLVVFICKEYLKKGRK